MSTRDSLPGHELREVIYRKYTGPDGKPAFEKVEVDLIDALDATKRHPNEWSRSPWPESKPAQVIDLTPPRLEAVKPELLPEPREIEAEPRRGFGGSHVIRKPEILN
jgi:hypothetical protein